MTQQNKPAYEAPKVTVIGSFEEVTQASNNGVHADQTIPTGGVIVGHLS
jgi:hypothetical protein